MCPTNNYCFLHFQVRPKFIFEMILGRRFHPNLCIWIWNFDQQIRGILNFWLEKLHTTLLAFREILFEKLEEYWPGGRDGDLLLHTSLRYINPIPIKGGQIKPTKRLVPTEFESFPPGLPYVGSITTEKYSISTTNLERTQPVFKRFHGPSLYEGQAQN